MQALSEILQRIAKYQISNWQSCPKPHKSNKTESKSETNEGFVNETETDSFDAKDSKPKPNPKPNPKPIQNLIKSMF